MTHFDHPLASRTSRNPAKRTYFRSRMTRHGRLSVEMNPGDASAPLVVVLDGARIETPFAQTGSVRHSFPVAFRCLAAWLRSQSNG